MSSRTAFPGTITDGEVATALDNNSLPGGWIGYEEVTAPQNTIGTSPTPLTSLTIAVTVPAGRMIRVTGKAQFAWLGTSEAPALYIYEGGSQLDEARCGAVTAGFFGVLAQAVIFPSAGTHTYFLQADTTNATVNMVASSTQKAYILVEDLGSV